jgi:hypothetical protein
MNAQVVYINGSDRLVLKKIGANFELIHEHMSEDALGDVAWSYKNSISSNEDEQRIFLMAVLELVEKLEASQRRENTLEFD